MSVSKPSKGTHFSDGVRSGPILGSTFTAGVNVLTPSTQVPSPADGQAPGVYMTPTSIIDYVPIALGTAVLKSAAAVGGAGYLTLTQLNSINVTTLPSFNGQYGKQAASAYVLQLDVPRNVTITSNGNEAGGLFYVYGWDQYGMFCVEEIVGVNANTVQGKKAFLYIQGIYTNQISVGNISAGVGDVFGIPYLITSANNVLSSYWAGIPITTGTVVIGDQQPATATSGDVRGTFSPTPVSASNSVRRLTVEIYSQSGDGRIYNNAQSGTKILNNNPLNNPVANNVIVVTAYNHQLTTGENVTISGGSTNVGTITPANYNITAPCTVIDANTFSYVALAAGNGNNTPAGGAVVTINPRFGNLFTTTSGRFGVPQYTVTPAA